MDKLFVFLQEFIIIYHIIHVIEALTTGAVNHTSSVNRVIKIDIIITFMLIGKNFIKYHMNIIIIVILNHDTAIK
jgi:hypothetical protein